MPVPALPTLPGEATVDDALVTEVVSRLNATLQRNGLETAKALGRIVLDAFFGGDPERFRSREKKHLSFRRLAEREDLHLSHVTLWNAVALVEQFEQLPSELGEALSVSHHRVLLSLRDPELKADLAKQAVEEHLSKRALAERVRRLKRASHRSSQGGRPPQPAFIKAINKLDAAVETAASELPTPAIVRAWGAERSLAALTDARARLSELSRIVEAIASAVMAAVGESDAPTRAAEPVAAPRNNHRDPRARLEIPGSPG